MAALEDGLQRFGADEPRAVPADGGEALVGFDLTTHQGHFMGSGHNRLLLYTVDGEAWVRAVGTWDPMPWHIEQSYRIAGRDAQHAFWGQGNDRREEHAAPAGLADRGVERGSRDRQRAQWACCRHPLGSRRPTVIVLEAAEHPGGAVRTEELTLPGFRHDTFSSVYPAAVASPVFASMPLTTYGLEWIHPVACMAHPLPDGQAAVLYRDLHATAESLDRQHPGDGQAWVDFTAPYLAAFPAVRATMLGGFPPIRGPLQLLRDAGPVRLGRLRAPARRLRGRARAAAV